MATKPTLDQFNAMIQQEMLDEDIACAKEALKEKHRRLVRLEQQIETLHSEISKDEQNIANGNFYLVV